MSKNNIVEITLSDDARKALAYDADCARRDIRADQRTRAFWDGVVATYGDGKGKDGNPKRAVIIRSVLVAAGEWRDDAPQKNDDGTRTEFGNVVQKFGARFDAAVKRAKGDDEKKPVDWLRLVRQAAENARNKGEHSPEEILAAVQSALAEVEG